MLPLHHSPILKNYQLLKCVILPVLGDGSDVVRAKRASFYSVSSRPWQARGDGCLLRGRGEAAAILRRRSRAVGERAAMSVYFEELDFRPTPMGVLSLRRRRQLASGLDVYEIKLGDEFLMSSLFTVAEIALARLGLAALEPEPVSTSSSAASGSATPRKPCWKIRRSVADRGRCVGRGDRMARAGAAAARQSNSPQIRAAASSMATSSRCRLRRQDSIR